MTHICQASGQQFEVSEAETVYCNQHGVPLPTLSPDERLRRVLNFRSSPYLHHAECAISGKRIITPIPPESGYRVYNSALEDQLDAAQYARPYDFSKSFFEQLSKLLHDVPYSSQIGVVSSNENCDFNHGVSWSKNCYLCFRCMRGEDCLYSRYLRTAKDVVECVWCVECELCYSCSDISHCFDLAFSMHCRNCATSRFLIDCIGCNDCFGCVGLTRARHCFFNEQLSPEEYRKRIGSIDLSKRDQCKAWSERLSQVDLPRRTSFIEKCEAVSGNYLIECGRSKSTYFCHNTEDVEYCIGCDKLKSSFFTVGMGAASELIYCCEAVGPNAYDVRFSSNCMSGVQHLEYCWNVSSGSTHCFGSVGLRRHSYCILNQQYSKAEYFDLVERIKRHMTERGEYGQQVSPTLSPYAFNRSEAYDFLPLAEADAVKRGYRWQQPDSPEVGEAVDMPNALEDISDLALQQKFRCPTSGKRFTIQKKELEFHRRMQIALPNTAPLVRITQRGAFLQLNA